MSENNVVKIVIDEEDLHAVHAADVEQSARREVLVSCIERGMSLENSVFKNYEAEYTKWFRKFSDLRSAIEAKYVTPKNTPERFAKNWMLDYKTRELTINY